MKFLNWLFKFSPFLVIVVAILVFFYPVWLKGKVPLPADLVVGSYFPWLDYDWGYPTGVPVKNPITSDAISFSFPMKMLAIDLMKSGKWPLWNPYILAGTPLLANFQSSPFSPTNFVYLFTDKLTGWSIQVILQHILAAYGLYLLLRVWKVSKIASVLAGTIFTFSGFNLIWSEWNSHTLAAAFIPFLILFVDRFFRQGKWWGPLISITLALQLFSGYPQIAFYSLITIIIFWVVMGRRLVLSKTFLLLFYVLLGFTIAAVQLLPGYELLSLSQRKTEVIPKEWAFLDAKQIITFIAPDYFGNHATGNFWGPKNYTSTIGFVSVVGLIFALFSLKLFKTKKEVKFLVLVTSVSLVLSLQNPLSNFIWTSGFLGLEAGVSLRALVLFAFGISTLAGFGFDYAISRKQSFRFPFILVGAVFLFFLFYSFTLKGEDLWKGLVARRNLVLPASSYLITFLVLTFLVSKNNFRRLGIACIFISSLVELFYFGWKFTPFSDRHIVFPETPVLKFLESNEKPFRVNGGVVPTNLLIPYKIESSAGYDAVYPLRTAKFIAVLNSGDSNSSPQDRYGIIDNIDSRLFSLMNGKYVLIKKDSKVSKDFQSVSEDKSIAVVENKNVLPRAFMVYDWEKVGPGERILDRLLDKDFPLGKKIILEEETNLIKAVSSHSQVNYANYMENASEISIKTDANGFLFVADTWYQGWKAFVNGKEVKIYRADYAFRAVVVPEGKSKVKFIYEPQSFYRGLQISTFSSLSVLLIFIFLVLKKRLQD